MAGVFSATSSVLTCGLPRPIDHTPDENEFQMTIVPSTKIIFMGADIGIKPITLNVSIYNDTALMQAFKVTCNMKPREMFEKYIPDGVKRIQCQFKYPDGTSVHPADPKPSTIYFAVKQ
uniref:Major sperm protein n=1 Tax=Setaria digitata TaxID=48799 RepID=A0A915PSE2_9BILA